MTDWGSRVTVRNSIFWDNTATNGPNVVDGEAGSFYLYEDEIYPSSTLDINYSIVNGWTGTFGGAGNSGADPVFADLDGLDDVPGTLDDDLRLTPGSPAINAGALRWNARDRPRRGSAPFVVGPTSERMSSASATTTATKLWTCPASPPGRTALQVPLSGRSPQAVKPSTPAPTVTWTCTTLPAGARVRRAVRGAYLETSLAAP